MATAQEDGSGSRPADSRDSTLPEASSTSFSERSHGDGKKTEPAKRNIWTRIQQSWTKAGLNTTTVLMMAKSGLAPTVATALIQVDAINALFPESGYVYGIVALLSLSFLPRAKFIQSLTLGALSISFGCAISQLAVYSSIKARQARPSPAGPDGSPGYNSSASAVLGVWLFLQIWFYSSFRARFPQFTFPVILLCVFTDVICTGATRLSTIMEGVRYVRATWYAFMLGFGTGAAVHFLVFPMSMRTVIFAEFSGYYGAVRKSLKAQLDYFHSLEDPENVRRGIGDLHDIRKNPTPQVQAVRGSIAALQGIYAKLHQDLTPAKREFAIGHLGPDHLNEMFRLNRTLFLPVAGLGAVVTIFEQLQDLGNLIGTTRKNNTEAQETHDERRERVSLEWSEYMQQLHGTFTAYVQIIVEGMEHVMLVLRLKTPEKWAAVQLVDTCVRLFQSPFKSKEAKHPSDSTPEDDTESKAGDTRPGSPEFVVYYEARIEQLYGEREKALRFWCQRKGIELSDDFFEHPETAEYNVKGGEDALWHRRRLRLLYVLFYMEYLFNIIARDVLQYIKYVDTCKAKGVLSKKRLIVPGRKRVRKWVTSVFKTTGLSQDDAQTNPEMHGNLPTVDLGAAYDKHRDPEHLPPSNWLERAGDHLRTVPAFLRSHESQFGFRVALATMSVGVIAFIGNTQEWFADERVHWALFVIALCMSPTAGASIFALIGRVVGTVFAMLLCFAIWYIPDQKTPGIIVLMWLCISATSYIFVCKPRYFSYGTVTVIAILVIAGYQLEARKYRPQDTRGSVPYWPILQFGPRRLLNAMAGVAVAFFWTIFPFPISEHGMIRHGLGESLYLLANYHSLVTELIRARVQDTEVYGGPDDKANPEYWLERYRQKVLSKLTVKLAGLREYAGFLKYEIPVGGQFPRKQYNEIISLVDSLLNFMSLFNLASKSLNECYEGQSAWSRDFNQALDSAVLTNKEITILLSLFSASINSGVSLPPYLHTPEPYRLAETLEKLNRDLLGIRRLNEPYYVAFGVMQVSATCIVKDVDDLLNHIRSLVGELDFSFHLSRTSDDSSTTLMHTRTLEILKSREKKD